VSRIETGRENTRESRLRIRKTRKKNKKEEFTGSMGNMAPGNSFPQICVVSENEFALITLWVQEYEGSPPFSN
jgi:hypothetical protein